MTNRDEGLSTVKTLNKLVAILDSFTTERPAWTLADLSVELDMPKSSLHRLLVGLEQHGILIRDADDSRWRLGYRLFVWGNLVPRITGLQHIAGPIVRWLAETTDETVLLTIYERGEVVCIDKVESSHAVRLTLDVGARRPAHAGASSKILMAYLPPEEIEAIIRNKGLPSLNTNTITDPARLSVELGAIRGNGYAFSYEETDIGAWGVATPILNGRGQVVAAIGVAGPTTRFSEETANRYVELCRQSAGRITRLLSGENSSE
jgi:DNA-binding IclR family transcriptional regulator